MNVILRTSLFGLALGAGILTARAQSTAPAAAPEVSILAETKSPEDAGTNNPNSGGSPAEEAGREASSSGEAAAPEAQPQDPAATDLLQDAQVRSIRVDEQFAPNIKEALRDLYSTEIAAGRLTVASDASVVLIRSADENLIKQLEALVREWEDQAADRRAIREVKEQEKQAAMQADRQLRLEEERRTLQEMAEADALRNQQKILKVFRLQHAECRQVAELISQLLAVNAVPDARTNSLVVEETEARLDDIEQLIQVLDEPAKLPAANAQILNDEQAAAAAFEEQRRLEQAQAEAANIALEWLQRVQPTGSAPGGGVVPDEVRRQLHEAVAHEFDIRQQQQQLEVQALEARLQSIRRVIEYRTLIREEVVRRRVEDLLNPAAAGTPQDSLPNSPRIGGPAPGDASLLTPMVYGDPTPDDQPLQVTRPLSEGPPPVTPDALVPPAAGAGGVNEQPGNPLPSPETAGVEIPGAETPRRRNDESDTFIADTLAVKFAADQSALIQAEQAELARLEVETSSLGSSHPRSAELTAQKQRITANLNRLARGIDTQIELLQLDIHSALAELDDLRDEYAQLKSLFESGAVPISQVAAAGAEVRRAENRLSKVRALLKLYLEAVEMSPSTSTSPSGGTEEQAEPAAEGEAPLSESHPEPNPGAPRQF